ncbi:MAG: hypothetical protein A2725_03340 [Candidatus Magasanikbacteria bacterium RIFCSPHIGHO2_01_FULL_33_34]|uniref:Uncharacterized protein n=1 Tax=Candidatus Magasanikbacteria bacterium RIFCSPHIGHO2_01_FULL_33_34 TaxID=1798671 RepID=A0A1F6LHC3_9BACT|nr:MAG: hypothetical protein A2725_03340 [Candidatus Magasanikbacteria bacterium RIFCSPHIGHO2_01_FULL_33_34]OGH66163.1 MAG: hypothetical protein A3B83_00830 [Candidatus Magasanikbacteria bacterium RIFCSPHIGHO2_02_FULL_33_17]OGH76009.1 MAG: hypothetical protein A3A89_00740 [Candidatus Magasanikbacteria bacterium RIFCSPLOWO2_01_FULL_33_34]OGH81615.1 MAG: hypothetical protein A3F93_04765 [Candidatus Magasanikbacteria bacterium RIFCSPLOWO2_12_FULL_34_7]
MNKKIKLNIFATLILVIFSLVLTPTVLAGSIEEDFGLTYGTVSRLGNQDVRSTIASIINVILGLLGILALVGVLYGGFQMMVSGGNDEQAGQGRKAIIAGVVGLAIVLSAYAISSFVLTSLGSATGYGT